MGQYLSAPVTDKESKEEANERLAYGLSAMQGWRVSMEDAHISELSIDSDQTALFSVFDGHGGGAVSKFAAKHMPYWLVRMEAYKRGDFGTAIAEAYYKLDEILDTEAGQEELKYLSGAAGAEKKTAQGLFSHIEDKMEGNNESAAFSAEKPKTMRRSDSSSQFRQSALSRHSIIPVEPADAAATEAEKKTAEDEDSSDSGEADAYNALGQGCTAVSVLVHGNIVVVANTGDSRCVMSRKGKAEPLTLDHKPIIYEEAQRIIKAGGFVRDNRVNGALNVSRTIGDLDFKRNADLPHTDQMVVATPDVTELRLSEGDEFLILACDGIWDVLSNEEAVEFVRKRIKLGHSLKAICEAMCDACLAPDLKGQCRGADNMSVIVVLFKKYSSHLDSVWYRMWGSFSGLFKRR